ncbi:MAG: hypothetical protein AAB113_09200, partial [Candidatus Eisenbacteria bacterium]
MRRTRAAILAAAVLAGPRDGGAAVAPSPEVPEAWRAHAGRTGTPVILVQTGIRSGEIEGKGASLARMRDIALLKTRAPAMGHLIAPYLN